MKTSFRVDLGRVRSKIGDSVKSKTDRITQKLVDGFVARSPVYTGNFRASWHVSEGNAVYVKIEGGSINSVLPPPQIRVNSIGKFPVMHITNGQPYAAALEYGWSSQAPSGMVRVTIASLR